MEGNKFITSVANTIMFLKYEVSVLSASLAINKTHDYPGPQLIWQIFVSIRIGTRNYYKTFGDEHAVPDAVEDSEQFSHMWEVRMDKGYTEPMETCVPSLQSKFFSMCGYQYLTRKNKNISSYRVFV